MAEVADLIIKIAAALGGIGGIGGIIFGIYKWIMKQNQQDDEIKELRDEQTLICYGVLAALKGLKEQGCNGPVTEAINKFEKHLNVQAHKWHG
mgnify:CR=1 FL=1